MDCAVLKDGGGLVMTAGSLAGRTALVTGATRGIGRAIAKRLRSQGARVVGTGTRGGGGVPDGCEYCFCDFSDPEATRRLAADVGILAPDVLINNAGVNRIAPFEEVDPAEFEWVQRVNVTAPFLLCRAALPGMRSKGWGRIVNIASIWGNISRAQRAAYSTSKFGLDGMTAALAAEVARDGILANCVSPGFTDTELTRRVLGEKGIAELAAQIPIGRLAQPEEIAALVGWLVGPENTYISGQNLVVDGGFTRV